MINDLIFSALKNWKINIAMEAKNITCPARPPVINILIDIVITKKLYKKNFTLLKSLLKNISWLTKYIANANIGLYETWLMNGVGLETIAFLKGGIISNQTK